MCKGRTGGEGRKGGSTECGGPVGFRGGQKRMKAAEGKRVEGGSY